MIGLVERPFVGADADGGRRYRGHIDTLFGAEQSFAFTAILSFIVLAWEVLELPETLSLESGPGGRICRADSRR